MNKFFEAMSGFRNHIFPAKMESIQHGLNVMESSLRNALKAAGEAAYEALSPLVLAAVLPIARLGEAAYDFASTRTAKLTTVLVAAKFALEACAPLPVTPDKPIVESTIPGGTSESSVSPVMSPEAAVPTSSVEMQGGGSIFYINNYEEIVGSEAAANVRAKAQDLMPWLGDDFKLNYMGPMGDSVDKAKGGFILARDNKDRVYVVGEIIANPNGSGSAIRSVGGPIDVETADDNSIVMNFFDPKSESIRSMMTQDANGVVSFVALDGVTTIAQGVHLDVGPNSVKLASTNTDIPIFGFSFDKDVPFPVSVIDGVARYELDGEMWVSSEGKYLRAPMREDGTSYDIWKDDNNVIRVGEKATDWTYLTAVDMTIVSMETGIPVETTYREFETPTIASLIQSGAKFRIDNQGTLVAYDPETDATLAELIDPDYWEWKYASDVENLDLPSVVKFDVSVWVTMDQPARDEALLKLPEISPDGYMKGGFSEVKDSLVKFYDGGLLVQVYDFKNGKYMTPEQAGIIEFNMVDNQKVEMLRFATGQEAVDYLAFVEGASMSTQEQAQYYKDYPEVLKEYKAKHGTNGSNYPPELNRQFISGFEVSFEQGKFGQSGFGVFLESVNGGSKIGTLDQDGNIIDVYVDQIASQVSRDLTSGNIFAPVN